MKSVRYLSAACSLAVLSACVGTTLPVADTRLSYAEIADIASRVNTGYNAVSITPKALVPLSGTANYSGAVGGTINTTTVGGVMSASVNFGSNTITGNLGNFVTAAGDNITGGLSLSRGILNRTSNSTQVAIFADVDGTLRSAAGETIVVDARLRNSGFKGTSVTFIGGDVEGTVLINGAPGTINMRTQLQR